MIFRMRCIGKDPVYNSRQYSRQLLHGPTQLGEFCMVSARYGEAKVFKLALRSNRHEKGGPTLDVGHYYYSLVSSNMAGWTIQQDMIFPTVNIYILMG